MDKPTLPEIEQLLKKGYIPNEPFPLGPGVVICDPVLFVKQHLSILQGDMGRQSKTPYYLRLAKFIKQINKNGIQ